MNKNLHILSLYRRAGVEVMFLNFLHRMKNYDPDMFELQVVYAMNLSEEIERELKNLGIEYYKAKRKNKWDFTIIFDLIKVLKKNKISTIYSQNFTGNIWGGIASLLARVTLIAHEHGTIWSSNIFTKLLNKLWINKSSTIICNSYATKTILLKRYNVPEKKLKVIHNGVPYKYNEKGSEYDEFNKIVFIGRLDSIKSPKTIIYSMPYVLKNHPHIKLDIVGEGSERLELETLVSELGLKGKVKFHGSVKDVNEYLKQSAFLILPSIRESLGNVIIEAGLMSKPSIGTNIDGIAEVIVNYDTGILIDPTIEVLNEKNIPKYVVNPFDYTLTKPKRVEPNELAKAINYLLEGERFRKYGERARKNVISKFSFDKYYAEIIKILH